MQAELWKATAVSQPNRDDQVMLAHAHEVNNQVTIVLLAVFEAMEMLPKSHPSRLLLEDALTAGQRIANLARGLQNYGVRIKE